jgi:hypothetical protein
MTAEVQLLAEVCSRKVCSEREMESDGEKTELKSGLENTGGSLIVVLVSKITASQPRNDYCS